MATKHDEDAFVNWLKNKAEAVRESNIYESKSWLLTASILFPSNISMKVAILSSRTCSKPHWHSWR